MMEATVPSALRVLLASDPESDTILDAAGEGHLFTTLSESIEDSELLSQLQILLYPRSDQRHSLPELQLEMHSAPSALRGRYKVLDFSNYGMSFLLPEGHPIMDLLPNAQITGLILWRAQRQVLGPVKAIVRNVKRIQADFAPDADGLGPHGYRVGIEFFEEPKFPASNAERVISNPTQALALLREGLRMENGTLTVQLADDPQSHVGILVGRVDTAQRLLSLTQPFPSTLRGGEGVKLSFTLSGKNYSFVTTLQVDDRQQATNDRSRKALLCPLPKMLSSTHRRTATRFRPSVNQQVMLTLTPPVTGDAVIRPTIDVSTRGASFAIDGQQELFPVGSIIPRLTIHLPRSQRIQTRARVSSLRAFTAEDGTPRLRCGIIFDELDRSQRARLADGILATGFTGITESSGYDSTALWQLLLDTNFLYPEKLEKLKSLLPEIQHTLSALLSQPDGPVKTLFYKTEDNLQGHISAAQVYQRTWMVQHLAARKEGRGSLAAARKLNLAIFYYLEQMPDLEWIRIYFRPNNRWPARVVGNFIRKLKEPNLLDFKTLSYMVGPTAQEPEQVFPAGTMVRQATPSDLAQIEEHFIRTNNIVELKSSDLSASSISLQATANRYSQAGLYRRRDVLAVVRADKVIGFTLMEATSFGINFSELTNSFSVHQIESDELVANALISHARAHYARLGRQSCIAMVTDQDVPLFERKGFTKSKEYTRVTWHRSIVRQYFDNVVRLFTH
jgi:hypothetical protein